VTAVLGPPGSGKTTLISHWARSGLAPGPVAWLTLDSGDNAPRPFWTHVLASLRHNLPENDLPPLATSPVDMSTPSRLASFLSRRPTPVVLVLDQVEAITDLMVRRDLDLLLRYSGPGLRLVVCGRHGRITTLHRHRLAGDLVEIGAADLALTTDEMAELLGAHSVHLDEAAAQALHKFTEGWTTGVCLHALALRSGADTARIPTTRGRQAVASFLHAELLEGLPARVRDLLLRTSILDQVEPELADQLTGRCDARGILDGLAHANAFVTHTDTDRYRYQNPLRMMLADALDTTHPDLVPRLHAIAARWYAAQRSPEAAIDHAGRAGEWDLAADVAIDQIGVAGLLTAPGCAPVRERLADLPDGSSGVAVDLVRCVLALARYDVRRAQLAVWRARAGADRLDRPLPGHLLAIDIVRVLLARLTADVDTAAAAAGRYRATATEAAIHDPRARGLVLSNLGVAQLWAGRIEEARTTLSRAATAAEPGTEFGAHDALGHLALLAMYEGRMHRAEKYAHESVALADQAGIAPAARSGAASAALAAAALVWNDLAAARHHAADAIGTTGARIDPPTAATLALVHAWTACARRDGHRAIAATETARACLPRQARPQLFADRIELTALWAYLIVGDLTSARGCVDRIGDTAEQAVARGYLLEAEGDHAGARAALASVSAHDASPSALQYASLALGRLAATEGDLAAATRALRDALDYGRPEHRRRPVSDTGTWAPRLLRENSAIAGEHSWLTPSQDTGIVPDGLVVADALTDRELVVLCHLTNGLSTKDIASDLHLSVNTVKTHLKSIYRKLGTADRSAAARRARELNLLPHTGDPTP
jgi:LuxR family maltose regulon positive regulatory protein